MTGQPVGEKDGRCRPHEADRGRICRARALSYSRARSSGDHGCPVRVGQAIGVVHQGVGQRHPGLTHAGLTAETDGVRVRKLITDGLAEVRQRSLIRRDDDGQYWPA
ncbi:hypothetical protein OG426_40485 [Streptomyces canus]|uniref:hypothetical protein n=1 Tax=Streptomyces canus TaxID=58343 RepID=UPI003869CDDE|nr:hypothetical protein OG426_40485 [Streptomyces canus]